MPWFQTRIAGLQDPLLYQLSYRASSLSLWFGIIICFFLQAAVFFNLAAQQGHSHAQYKLGTYHLDGRGNVEPCEQTALTLITQAAEGGVVQVGEIYHMNMNKHEEEGPNYIKAVTSYYANTQFFEKSQRQKFVILY